MATTVHMACQGCGAVVSPPEPYPFRCPRTAEQPDADHVLVRHLDVVASGLADAFDGDEPNPFVRYRRGLYPHVVGQIHGLGDAEQVEMVRALDAKVEAVDGHGFRVTPLRDGQDLADAIGLKGTKLWLKDETANVSGSHKARHILGIQIWLATARRLGWIAGEGSTLAIASCGNAALAAAVVAKAAGETLRVFVPVDAEDAVIARLHALGAHLQPCRRRGGERGDPCLHAFHAALDDGLLPYGCQGSENGMTLEGGRTLGYEIVDQLRRAGGRLDHLVVQVGGGALASSLILALRDAVALGLLDALPRIHTVQTASGFPLHRAWSRLVDRLLGTETSGEPDLGGDLQRAAAVAKLPPAHREAALQHAATHRGEFMWAWETTPRSIASGILDDETYDWWRLAQGMIDTGGVPVVAGEPVLRRAHGLAQRHTGLRVCATGSSGVAGLMDLATAAAFADGEQVGIVLSGHER